LVGSFLCPRQNDRLVALVHQIEEETGLFHSVGAVSDNDSVDVIRGQFLGNRVGNPTKFTVSKQKGSTLQQIPPANVYAIDIDIL
jgi:hypothetical protein